MVHDHDECRECSGYMNVPSTSGECSNRPNLICRSNAVDWFDFTRVSLHGGGYLWSFTQHSLVPRWGTAVYDVDPIGCLVPMTCHRGDVWMGGAYNCVVFTYNKNFYSITCRLIEPLNCTANPIHKTGGDITTQAPVKRRTDKGSKNYFQGPPRNDVI